MLGGGGRELLQPRELAVGLLAHDLGQLELGELLAQLLDLGLGRVALPELLLDRLELLAQVVLALGLVHLGLDLRVDPRADLDAPRARARGSPRAAAAACATSTSSSSAWRSSVGIRSAPAIRCESADGSSRLATAICSSSGRYGACSMICVNIWRTLRTSASSSGPVLDHVGQLGDARDEVGLGRGPLLDPHALAALHEHAQRAVGHLEHARDGAGDADLVELLGPGLLGLGVAAGDHHEPPVGGQHVVDQRDRARLADGQRRQRVRERDGVAQRQDRQRRRQRGRLGRGRLALADGDHGSSRRSGSIRTVLRARRAARAAARRSASRPRRRRWPRRRRRRRRARRRAGTGRARSRAAGRRGPRRSRAAARPDRISSRPRISSAMPAGSMPARSARTIARGGSPV